MYTLNGWWFLSSGGSYPPVFTVGKLKSYLDYIHLPGLSSLPFLVTVMLNLAPNNQLGKLDHIGSFSTYLN